MEVELEIILYLVEEWMNDVELKIGYVDNFFKEIGGRGEEGWVLDLWFEGYVNIWNDFLKKRGI